jgi:hypothetical protein
MGRTKTKSFFEAKKGAETLLSLLTPQKVSPLLLKYQGEFSLVEGFKLAFLREIIYSSCQKIFLKCCLPIFPD